MNRKRVGVIGSGIVGQTLTGEFVKHGFETMLGSREPGKVKEPAAKLGARALATAVLVPGLEIKDPLDARYSPANRW